jgi:hypothetical protein
LDSNIISHPDAKHSASAARLRQSAPKADRCSLGIEDNDIFPEVISQLLQGGHKVRFQAPGKSMRPVILDGDVLLVEPIEPAAIKIGDIILYQADEHIIAHRVVDIEKVESQNAQSSSLPHRRSTSMGGCRQVPTTHYSFILRGDASYSYDEPVYSDQLLGKVIAIERTNRNINPYTISHKLTCMVRVCCSRIKRFFF